MKLASYIRFTANKIFIEKDPSYWASKIKDSFDMTPVLDQGMTNDPWILREIYNILSPISCDLIKACGIKNLNIRSTMGPNKPYYPNHGYFIGDQITLNGDIFVNPDLPDDFIDHKGYFITRGQQTLIHELGHGFDHYHDNLSLKPAWLSLSGWNETYEPGLKRLHIKDQRAPEVIGEWFYSPDAEFTRFYAKRNPWDDFADAFAFYVADLKNKVPLNKKAYFDNLLKKYT